MGAVITMRDHCSHHSQSESGNDGNVLNTEKDECSAIIYNCIYIMGQRHHESY